MNDKAIRDAVHDFEGNYEQLATLLACYEAWGGGPAHDADCDCLLGERRAEDR